MCGIAGIWNGSGVGLIKEMAEAVAHRGPDRLDYLSSSSFNIGASRLIISGAPDVSAIFHDSETKITVLLNGEIYNVDSLRRELSVKGYQFSTDLESEVVNRLYQHYGLDFATHLKGMFAVAILDDNRLVLARDKLGIKPMYFVRSEDQVIFGSEIKAILKHPDISASLNLRAIEEIYVFGYVHSPGITPFEGISQVKPGTVIDFSRDSANIIQFWQPPEARYFNKQRDNDYDTSVRELREIIINSIDLLYKHGDQLKGLYLSGGLDSSIIALVIRSILGYSLLSFTIADNSENGDFIAAKQIAHKLGAQHIERIVTTEDFFQSIEHYVYHYESLIAGGVFDIYGGIAFHLLSETVSDYVKVAFTGEGADELFGGYYWPYTHPLGFADTIRSRMNTLSPRSEDILHIVDRMFPLPEDERVYQRHVFDTLTRGGLSNYHLQNVDRSSGAFGFEIRPVYLFDDLAEFALDLPIEFKVQDKQVTKRILRDAFKPELEKLGLDWIINRPKESMPSAIKGLDLDIKRYIEGLSSEPALARHPFNNYLSNKTDMYFFDIFTNTFLTEN